MLISGNSYNLSSIFSQEILIIIPDMQREYCWAKTISEVNNKSLVQNFLVDLIDTSINQDKVQMGLLYAYESPKNHIQLCDGQQRITSLYLLLGWIHNNISNAPLKKKVKDFLILPGTNFGMAECRLQYAIRESTLFFTRDLVNNIFLKSCDKKENIIDHIKRQDWYFNDYDLDPSIQNMLEALNTFQYHDNAINDNVVNHILNNINFLYFDMENRTYGEEQFVVLNTTGKPLTITENIKPKILGDLDDNLIFKVNKTKLRYYADLWEDWELYFWTHRNKHQLTADKGLNEFFRWIYVIENSEPNLKLGSESETYTDSQKALVDFIYDISKIEESNIKTLDFIEEYFQALKRISQDIEIKKRFLFQFKQLTQIQIFEFLPLLTYVKNFNCNVDHIGYIRLKNFLKSRAKDSNVSKASSTAAIRSIQIVKSLYEQKVEDIANFHTYEKQASETILSDLEKFKFNVLLTSSNRSEVENAFWEAELFNTSEGNIEFIFDSMDAELKDNPQDFELNKFIKVKDLVNLTFNSPNDLMRRSLLTFGHYYNHDGITPTLSSDRFSLGKNSNFYGSLANERKNEKSEFLINFLRDICENVSSVSNQHLNEYMQNRVDNFVEKDGSIWERTRTELIKNENLLSQMGNNLFCVSEKEDRSYILKKQKVTKSDAYVELKFDVIKETLPLPN